MTSFTEGVNCYLVDYTIDYREIATVVTLKGGKDDTGQDITVTVQDETAIAQYGMRAIPFSESQWTTQTLCQLRALRLLSDYSKPAININLDVQPDILAVGDTVTLVLPSLNLNDAFKILSVAHGFGSKGETTRLELTNRSPNLSDLLSSLQRNLEKR